MMFTITLATSATEYSFDPTFFGSSLPETSDLSVFASEGGQLPGVYNVDIILNGQFVTQQPITFFLPERGDGVSGLQPLFTPAQLYAFGLREGAIPNEAISSKGGVILSNIPYASMTFLFHQRQVQLMIPTTLLRLNSPYEVDPARWDEGINAALFDYRISSLHQFSRSSETASYDAQEILLLPGLNLGAWRYRNYSQLRRNSERPMVYTSGFNSLERQIGVWQSRLILGDSNTQGDIFASVPFSGIQLSSDLAMLPSSTRNFSPQIWGIARTPARVTVTQGEYLLHSGSITPGPFELNNITPIDNGGDVVLRIEESDGQVQLLTFPFARLPVLLREGVTNYGLTAGHYRTTDASWQNPAFLQYTQATGLPWEFTLYGGAQLADAYQAFSLGVGTLIGQLGAISVDRTQTTADTQQGATNRLRYSKVVGSTGSSITAAYQHASVDFLTLEEAIDSRWLQVRRRSADLNLTQPVFATNGYLSLRWLREQFHTSGQRTSLSAAYRQPLLGSQVSLGISESQRKNRHSLSNERQLSLSVSVPIGRTMQNNYVGYGIWVKGEGHTTQMLNVNGSALEEQAFSWGAQQRYDSDRSSRETSFRGDYRGAASLVSLGYGHSDNVERLDYAAQGGMVLHDGGLTLSPYLGETLALLDVSGTPGVTLQDNPQVITDAQGYALVPYLSPYSVKSLQISPGASDRDFTLPTIAHEVVPTRGAIVKAHFTATKGRRVLMTLQRKDNRKVPFGASASLQENSSERSALVGEDGEVYLTGMPDSGILQVQWGKKSDQQCQVSYSLPDERPASGIFKWVGQCR